MLMVQTGRMRPRLPGMGTNSAMRRTVLILSGLFALGAAGSRQSIVQAEPGVEFGKKPVAGLQAHDFATFSSQLDPSIKTGRINQHIGQVAALIPQESPDSIELANWALTFTRSDRMGGGTSIRRVVLALQYEFSDRWQLMQYVWRSEGGGAPLVKTFHIAGPRDSLEHLHGFWRPRFTLARLIVFLAAVILPLSSIYALIRCIRARMRVR